MDKHEFNSQVDRLKSTWPSSFPDEKVHLIWTAVFQHDLKWFEKVVSNLIANSRAAPLPTDFMEAARQKDRQEYMQPRFPNNAEIHPSENSIFSKKDIAEFFELIRNRIAKRVSSEEINQIIKILLTLVNKPNSCQKCEDGIVFTETQGSPRVAKCRCHLGQRRQENWAFA